MEIENTYITTQQCSTRAGGTHAVITHDDYSIVELNMSSLRPHDDWYLIKVMATNTGAGMPYCLHTIVVKG